MISPSVSSPHQVVGCVNEGGGEGGDGEAVSRVLQGLSDMATWAESDWSVSLH